MPPSDPSRQPPGLLARLAARRAWRGAAAWLGGLALALAVAAGAGWLLTPGGALERYPGEEALGTPAPGTIQAPRDREIADEEATARLREEAAAAELPIYDQDEEAAADAAQRLRAAFQAARQALSEQRRRDRPARDRAAAAREAFEARLGQALRDPEAAALAEARWSEAAEQRAAALVGRALAGMVVDDRERLAAHAERGLVVRALRGGALQGERVVLELAPVRDLPAVRRELERERASREPPGPALREAVVRLAGQLLRPTLSFNLAETVRRQREAADRVGPVVLQVRRGERIVAEGERIERRHLVIFRGLQAQAGALDRPLARAGGGLLVLGLVLLLWRHGRSGGQAGPTRREAVVLAALFLLVLGLTVAGLLAGDAIHDRFPRLSPEALRQLTPYAAGALVARSLFPAGVGLRFAVASGLAVGLLAGHSPLFALQAVLTALAASALAPQARRAAGLPLAGLGVGLAAAALTLAGQLYLGRGPAEALVPAGLALAGGAVLVPLLAALLLPAAERALGRVTEARLRELANLNHPALKDLIVQAPGTYHHAVVMGTMVEAAARAVGGNPLLARVCAYYHDVGKTRNPSYFSENQRGENRHEQLAPSMSALIVKRHVADGLELCARWKLPRPVVEAVAQHHGTRLVSYFWSKARKAAEEGTGPWESPAAVDEALFRYPGPRPRTREATLVMLADVVEASARAQADTGPDRLLPLVQRRTDELLAEGQLDESPLTLRELRAAGEAMARALEAVYAARPEDPARPPGQPSEPDRKGLHLVARS